MKHYRIILLALLLIVVFITIGIPKEEIEKENYLASILLKVELYDQSYDKVLELPRGTKVKVEGLVKGTDYVKIIYDDEEYLVKEENINEDIVLEKTIYVRTPCVLYENDSDSKIRSYLKKGEALEVLGYDFLDDGNVNMYKVQDGYVYAKYIDLDEDSANKYYDNGYYDVHESRTNTLGGGDAASLDYYPYIKPVFSDNVMPDEVRSLYISSESIKNIDEYIKLAKDTNINAFVVDIKDNTSPAYKSQVMKELSSTNYEKAIMSIEEYQEAIKKIKDNDFYVIGRITVFKDDYYALDNLEDTIYDGRTNEPYIHNGSYWPSAYSRNVWYFNVELAKEASLMGFNEIQFDYVRFPDRTSSIDGYLDYKNEYDETKAQAIQGFVMYACDELHKLNVYVSIDVFAESAHQYVTSYGQYFPAISNVADVISPMSYPDHFNKNQYGIINPVWAVPYELLSYWSKNYVLERQKETTTPAIVRSWIQAYDTIHEPYVTYDSEKISDQIKALYNSGLTNGFITWNSSSSLVKYKLISDALSKNYKE